MWLPGFDSQPVPVAEGHVRRYLPHRAARQIRRVAGRRPLPNRRRGGRTSPTTSGRDLDGYVSLLPCRGVPRNVVVSVAKLRLLHRTQCPEHPDPLKKEEQAPRGRDMSRWGRYVWYRSSRAMSEIILDVPLVLVSWLVMN